MNVVGTITNIPQLDAKEALFADKHHVLKWKIVVPCNIKGLSHK